MSIHSMVQNLTLDDRNHCVKVSTGGPESLTFDNRCSSTTFRLLPGVHAGPFNPTRKLKLVLYTPVILVTSERAVSAENLEGAFDG